MSHFAQVINGIVTQVIVAEQDFINSGAVGSAHEWIQTSYNTRGGIHYDPNTNKPDDGIALRGNYAGIGHTYDSIHDVFYAPRPKDRNGISCDSWTISAPKWIWTAPTPSPNNYENLSEIYLWDEPTKMWVKFTPT